MRQADRRGRVQIYNFSCIIIQFGSFVRSIPAAAYAHVNEPKHLSLVLIKMDFS